MRTDVTIDTKNVVKLPQFGYPNNLVYRGDFIKFKQADGTQSIGRSIGSLINPDDGHLYICVVALYSSGFLAEYWVRPEYVVKVDRGNKGTNLYADKAKWFFSDDFLRTSVDQQRQISEILMDEIRLT